MSGIEVAGLVLGAFPLLITALEHYRDAAEVLNIFWKIKREYANWTHDLMFCQLAFESNLETLLLPLIVDDDEVGELIQCPGGPKWKEPELEERLKERLSKSYLLYLESINHIQEVMEEIKKHLGADKPGFQTRISAEEINPRTNRPEVSFDDVKANIDFQARRIKMSFSKSKRDSLFQKLTKGNEELRSLLDASDRIATLRQSRGLSKKKAAEGKKLWQFWRQADKLYNLLARAWLCECKKFHLVHLLLQHRTTPSPDFRVCFFFGPGPRNCNVSTPTWTHQEAKVKLLEDVADDLKPTRTPVVGFAPDPPKIVPLVLASPLAGHSSPSPQTPSPTAVLRTPSPTPSSTSSNSKADYLVESKKSLRRSILTKFKMKDKEKSPAILTGAPPAQVLQQCIQLAVLPPPSPRSGDQNGSTTPQPLASPTVAADTTAPQLVITAVTNDQQKSVADSDEMIEILNLCAEIPRFDARAKNDQPFCLKGRRCRVALNPVSPPKATSAAVRDTVSLETLLRSDSPRPLTRRERYLVALTLASSYLQLKASPWIWSGWSKRDILFLRDGGAGRDVRLDQPYISRGFVGGDAIGGDGDDDDNSSTRAAHAWVADRNDRSLANLGIMLLELCFGTALEEHETRRRYSSVLVASSPPPPTTPAPTATTTDNKTADSNNDKGNTATAAGTTTTPASAPAPVPPANPFLDMAAALEWFPRAAEEAGPEFAGAIEWCLKNMPGYGGGAADGNLDRWREELFERVVLPVKYCHDLLGGVRLLPPV